MMGKSWLFYVLPAPLYRGWLQPAKKPDYIHRDLMVKYRLQPM